MESHAATSAVLLRISSQHLRTCADGFAAILEVAGISPSSFNSKPPLPQFQPDARDAYRIAHILRTRILVSEYQYLFRNTTNRRSVIKIVSRLFLYQETSEYASLLVDGWRADELWDADLKLELNDIVSGSFLGCDGLGS